MQHQWLRLDTSPCMLWSFHVWLLISFQSVSPHISYPLFHTPVVNNYSYSSFQACCFLVLGLSIVQNSHFPPVTPFQPFIVLLGLKPLIILQVSIETFVRNLPLVPKDWHAHLNVCFVQSKFHSIPPVIPHHHLLNSHVDNNFQETGLNYISLHILQAQESFKQ